MITIAHDFGINAPYTNSMHVDCFTHRWNRRSRGPQGSGFVPTIICRL